MQRFNENFNISPQQPSWEDRRQPLGCPQPRDDIAEQKDEASRSRSPTSVTLNDLDSPGLESVLDTEAEKEVVPRRDYYAEPEVVKEERRICGMRRVWFILALLLATCVVIAIGVGLGVSLGRESGRSHKGPGEDSPASLSGPPTNSSSNEPHDFRPQYYSMTGAFNGTGIALASQSFGEGGYGTIVMYFQHHTGQIRFAQLRSDGTWQGGSSSEVLADNAKNATPIAAVAYALNETASWHLFYIDQNNTIRERVQDNNTNLWSDGPINDLNIKAMDSPNVGLQACRYGSFYGDAQYKHSPVPGQIPNDTHTTESDQTVGIHLWYGDSDTSFKEVGWTYGDSYWTEEDTSFQGYNGHAGVGCYTWGPGSVSYLFMMNLDGALEILWKDLNTSITPTSNHSINTWTSSLTIPSLFPNTSLGYTNYLYAQTSELSISGYNISWAAENTSIVASDTFVISGARGMAGTHLSVTALPDESGGDSLLAFYQTNGSDITEFVRDFEKGQWTSDSIPIPDA